MATWKVISEVTSSIDRDKKIYIVECKKCKHISEFMLNNKDELKSIKCEECIQTNESNLEEKKEGKRTSHSQAKVDDNLRYRLKAIWLRLKKEGKLASEWEGSYENFRDWSLDNGYTYFKILERKNKNISYRPSNCIWVLNKYISGIERIDDTLSFKVRLYGNILTRTDYINEHVNELKKEIDILESLSGIDQIEVLKLKKKIAKIKKDMELIEKIEDTVWPSKDKVEGRG